VSRLNRWLEGLRHAALRHKQMGRGAAKARSPRRVRAGSALAGHPAARRCRLEFSFAGGGGGEPRL